MRHALLSLLLAAPLQAQTELGATKERGLLENLQDILLYQPSRGQFQPASALKVPYEDVEVEAADGERLHGWFFPGKPGAPVFLYSHGNGGNMSGRLRKVKLLLETGAGVLAYDYRGYGRSTGRPTEQGTYLDVLAFHDWLTTEKGVPGESIVSYGESLGAAIATELSGHRPTAGLVLEGGFTSVVDMAKHKFSVLPLHRAVTFRYDTLQKLPGIKVPVLVMHAVADEMIPYAMGEALFAAAPGPRKMFFPLKGGHNDGFVRTPEYAAALRAFLTWVPGAR